MESEALLAQIGPQGYDQQIRQFLTKHKRLSSKEVRSKGLEAILGAEDDQVGTGIEYLLTLSDCVAAAPDNIKNQFDNLLWVKRIQYLERFDSIPVRYAGKEFRELVESIHSAAVKAGTPHLAILPMRNALLRLDPSGETFTSLHLPYLQICLEMALYAEALPVLDRAIYNFPATTSSNLDGQYLCSEGRESSAYITYKSELTTQIHYRQVQEYYLLGGIIYLALGPRRYEDARLCFEMVLMSPTQNVATGFMLEAYRKWLLLGVLIDGKSPDIPKGVAPTASRVLQAAAKPYLALTAAFEQKEVAKLKGEIDAGLKLWDEDGNLGLVLHLPSAHQRHFIFNLQSRYASYPVSLIDDDVNHAMDVVSELISSGNINATLDTTSGPEAVIRFLSPATSANSTITEAQIQLQLMQQLSRTQRLVKAVKAADRKVIMSQEFVQAARKAKGDVEAAERREGQMGDPNLMGIGGAGPSSGGIGASLPGGWPADFGDVADEDLMEG